MSVLPFIITLLVTDRIRKYLRKEQETVWTYRFQVMFFSSIGLMVISTMTKNNILFDWIWIVFIGAILYLLWTLPIFKTQRKLFWAVLPTGIYLLIDVVAEQAFTNQYNAFDNYFEIAGFACLVWMASTIYGQNKLNKALEEERIKLREEEAKSRAIALRKVELEDLVAERTAEITAQKEALEKAMEELKATQAQLIQSEKMASLGELTAGIAHEIQNPLNFVNNFSEVSRELIDELKQERDKEKGVRDKVLEEELLSDIDANLEKINHHGKRAAAIVKGMLQHSRTSTGQKEPTDINALCDEYLRLAYHGLRAKDKTFNAQFETHFDENLPKVNIVPQDMGRVVLNIINNAFFAVAKQSEIFNLKSEKYEPRVMVRTKLSPRDGELVSQSESKKKIIIEIEDNGGGIPADIKEKIFQPFFTTKPTGQGTGLGLSLSYDIVQAHGGKLSVESLVGEGTKFMIEIPMSS